MSANDAILPPEERTRPVVIQRRTLPDSLRYLAGKLDDGFDPGAVAMVLRTLASEQEAERQAEASDG